MMKDFARWMMLAAVVLAVSLAAGCSEDDNPAGSGDPGTLPGTWNLSGISSRLGGFTYQIPQSEIDADPLTYVLNEDGSGSMTYQGATSPITWSTSGSTLTLGSTEQGYSESYEFTVTSTTLSITFPVEDEGVTYMITQRFTRAG